MRQQHQSGHDVFSYIPITLVSLILAVSHGAAASESEQPGQDGATAAAQTDRQGGETLASLRCGIISGDLPADLSLVNALERFGRDTVDRPEERQRLADGIVTAITKKGVDRHEFLEHVPYLAEFGCHAQLTILLLHDPGEDDYWLECCFYQEIMEALGKHGTKENAASIRQKAPERDREIFMELAADIERRTSHPPDADP